jgi:hypothetical protein
MKRTMTMAALLVLAGCATTTGQSAPAQTAETIRYQTSPCFGACPVYAVTVSSDGTGTFEGKRFTATTGAQSFTLTPAQFADFRERLAPFRPAEGEHRIASGDPDCGAMMTVQPSAAVTWSGGDAPPASLSLYYGCTAPELGAMKAKLRAAPEALPNAAYIGKP